MNKEKTKVTINGREFTILSAQGEEYVNRVAYDLDKRLKATGYGTVGISTRDVYTLTALNLIDELLQAKEALRKAQDEVKLLQEALKTAQIRSNIAAKDRSGAGVAIENELKRLREQCRRLDEENRELKKARVTSINKNVSAR